MKDYWNLFLAVARDKYALIPSKALANATAVENPANLIAIAFNIKTFKADHNFCDDFNERQ